MVINLARLKVMFYPSLYIIDETVTSGLVTVIIQFGPFPVTQEYKICDLLPDVNKTCPIEAGVNVIAIEKKIPKETPAVRERLLRKQES